MKQANKVIRTAKDRESMIAGLVKIGFTDAQAERVITPDVQGNVGFPTYRLTNNNANIKRIAERIQRIKELNCKKSTDEIVNGVRIVGNVEGNRVQIFFDGKPADEIRASLKTYGFRWAPSEGAWQCYYSEQAIRLAKSIINNEQYEPDTSGAAMEEVS